MRPAPIALQTCRYAGYSVRDEFAHGADPIPVWRNTEGRRVSWLNLVMVLYPAHCLQSLTASGCAPFWRANIDRKRQIWPAGWCGLHYVRYIMIKRNITAQALIAGIVIAGSRFLYEVYGILQVPDAQGGISIMFSIIVGSITFFLVFLFLSRSLRYFAKGKKLLGALFFSILIFVIHHTITSMLETKAVRQALFDASSITSSPTRLRSLIGYRSGFGYEIDNRLASNPATPTDVLRLLHGRPNQIGTEISLARNPNTPDDILLDLAKKDNEWKRDILDSLEKNRSYIELQHSVSGSIKK